MEQQVEYYLNFQQNVKCIEITPSKFNKGLFPKCFKILLNMLSVKNCWKIILPNRILQKQQNGQRCYFLDSENRSKALNYLVSHLHNLLITMKRNSWHSEPSLEPTAKSRRALLSLPKPKSQRVLASGS